MIRNIVLHLPGHGTFSAHPEQVDQVMAKHTRETLLNQVAGCYDNPAEAKADFENESKVSLAIMAVDLLLFSDEEEG